jgi:hypothetical protein
LLDAGIGRGGIAHVDLTIATGRCPHCGEAVLAP